MYLQLVNSYAFGETLYMFLWIALPLVVVFFLVTTWSKHGRRKGNEGLVFAVAGFGDPGGEGDDASVGDSRGATPLPDEEKVVAGGEAVLASWVDGPSEGQENQPGKEEEWAGNNENMYKGILWMKEKYEQYRDLADQRYERVKEELNRTESKYLDLVASLAVPPGKDETVASLKAQLKAEKQKVEDLTEKLQRNSELLMQIYKELDKSLYAVNANERV